MNTAPGAWRSKKMKIQRFATTAVLAAACALPGLASANVVENVTMDFQSGATFTGQVTFLDDFSQATAVSGTLNGGGYGTDPINWIWSNDSYGDASQNQFANYLMDSRPSLYGNYSNWIYLSVDYSNPNELAFVTGGANNMIDYRDAMVQGTIANAVPEPSTWALLLVGIGAMGIGTRRRARAAAAA
jgi:hypothetical protein